MVSSSNFVWRPPLPQIGVISQLSLSLGNSKKFTRCEIWWVRAADWCNWAVPCLAKKSCCTRCEKCVCVCRAYCRGGAGSSRHPAIFFPVVFRFEVTSHEAHTEIPQSSRYTSYCQSPVIIACWSGSQNISEKVSKYKIAMNRFKDMWTKSYTISEVKSYETIR